MAQRRMSRKSFRKSKGRKTRSMRKRTMGGDEFDHNTGLGQQLEALQKFNDSKDENETIDLTPVVSKSVEPCGGNKDCQMYKYNTYAAISDLLLQLPQEKREKVTAKLDNKTIGYDQIKRIVDTKVYKHKDKAVGGRKSRRKRKSRRR